MQKNKTQGIILLICIFFINIHWINANEGIQTADIFADKITYERERDTIYAKGNVEIYFENIRIFADIISYDRKNNTIYAWGGIDFKTEEYSLTASALMYNLETSTGVVYNVSIKAPPIYVCAAKIFIKSADEFFIPQGDITTCNHIPPCYRFSGKSINLKLDSWFSAFNTFLFFGNMPAFYFPYYFKNLGPEKLKIDINAGQSRRDGFFLRSKFSYPFTENSRSYIGADFMTKRGVGLKAGHTYKSSTGFSDFNAYYLMKKDSQKDNLSFDIKGWQKIKENLNFRYKTVYTSDFYLNFAHNRLMEQYLQRDIYWQFGFDYTPGWYIASIYGNKRETWRDGKYIISDFIIPGASLKLLPVKLPGRINFSADIDYKNLYISDAHWQSSIRLDNKLRGSYRINFPSYYITLSPGIGYDGEWRERQIFDDHISLFSGLNQGIFNILFLNNHYTFRKAVKKPHNITRNLLESELILRPFRQTKVSIKSSYNFKENITEPIGDFFSTAKLDFPFYNIFIRHRYDHYKKRTKEWLYELNIADFSESRIKYNYLFPERIDFEQNFNFVINPLKITLGVRLHLQDYRFDEFIEQSISIDWDMHCWQSQFKLLRRGEELQFWVLFNITAFPERKIGVFGNPHLNDFRLLRK